MTVTAASAKRTPVKAPGPQAPAPPPAAPSRRRGITPLTPMRVQAAKSMTKLADSMKESHPDMLAHQHVRDAARMLRSGNEEAAQRHLRAAMFAMTPQSLMRNGLHTDDHHVAARDAMHGIHRHLLLVKDVADVAAKNRAAIGRDSYDDDSSSPPQVTSPVRADPNAGYGPGALAQKPTARQPPGNQALNAPARSSSGGSDPAVADPVGTQPRGSKQFAYGWNDLDTLIEMSVVAGETGTIGARSPATAGTARGHGRPDESRTTWPRIRRTTGATTGSTAFAALPRISGARTAAPGRTSGPRSPAGQARKIPPTTGLSAAPATAYTTAAHEVSATALLISPNSRSWQSMLAGPRGRQSWPESSGSANPLSAASSTAGTGPGSLELSAQNPSCTTRESSPLIRSGRSGNGQARLLRRSPVSSAYRDGPSVLSAAARRTATSLDLSAETGRLAVTPAPYGKPGGPGLYGIKGNSHSPYFEQVVKALMEKRGMDKGRASKIAWASLRKWSAKSKHPEVRAASAGGLALEKVAEARAMANEMAHTWDDVLLVIDLAVTPAPPPAPAAAPASGQQGGALPARVAAGSAAGGQFSAGGGGQPAKGKTAATGKAGAKPDAHQKHIAHVAHLLKVSTAKAGLLVTAQDDRAKASALIKQRDALVKALASAGGKTSTGQSGSTTSANSTTSSTAPAASTATAAPASTATASTTTAAKTPAAAATAAPSASAPATSAAGLKTQIAALNTQISALLAQANQATAQAAKMK